MNFKTRFGNIYYEETGNGKPLLLVHDAIPGESAAGFERCKGRLSKKFRVYLLDLLGFGKSDKPSMEYSAYLYASIINAFIKEVIDEPVSAVARGRGAAFTVMASAFAPDYFSKMYLVKPKGMPAPPVKGIARAFSFIESSDIRYALGKGFLDADYKRVLDKTKIPARIFGGDCNLCDQLLAKKRNLIFGKADAPQISGGASEALDEPHKG